MALGNYSRIDGRKPSSSTFSTVGIVVFVALCLVGVWMMTSSSVDPDQNSDVSSIDDKIDVNSKSRVGNRNADGSTGNDGSDTDNKQDGENKQRQFEDTDNKPKQIGEAENKLDDGEGELPEGVTKGDLVNRQRDNAVNAEKESSSEISQEPKKQTKDKKGNGASKSEDKKEDGELKPELYFGDGEAKEGNAGDEEKKSEKTSEETKKDQGSSELSELLKETTTQNGSFTTQASESKNEKNSQSGGQSELLQEMTTHNGSFTTQASESKNEKNSQSGGHSELLKETTTQNGSFTTQASESKNEKNSQSSEKVAQTSYNWKVCNTSAGPDYIPCLDNIGVIRHLPSTNHYEHRERHCPENPPTCLVPLPQGYQQPIDWPKSREKIWYHNVPHTKLAEYKGHQNWVKVSGEFLTFPGGGTQFTHGALHYIDIIQKAVPDIAWGKHSRVVLDVGCGVASFGGYLFDRDVLTMSLAPKDEHEAQVQFALERGIPAISAVMGTKRLPYPGRAFDVVHCARCRVPWHIEGGKLLLELNRLLRPGGFFVWSATPVYRKDKENVQIWEAMKILTKSMCWEVTSITKDKVNDVGIAIFRKPTSNECYEKRPKNNPPLCSDSDDPNAAWNVPLQACMHKIPVAASERGSQWPGMWPARVENPPYWLSSTKKGVYGKSAPEDYVADYKHWQSVVKDSYLKGMGINWSNVRNVMDMGAIYGGFAAALREMNVWVMNIISVDYPDTLPIIYERGLFGIYHDWCESFSTYPRSYDLLHADHLFSKIKAKCNYMAFIAEVDRILRPRGKIIIRDNVEIVTELESMFKSMQWEIRMSNTKSKVGLLCAQKSIWRPRDSETVTFALT